MKGKAMARAAITRILMRDLPALPAGTAKLRIFDTQLSGSIAEQRRTGTTFYLRCTDHRARSREVKLGRLGERDRRPGAAIRRAPTGVGQPRRRPRGRD